MKNLQDIYEKEYKEELERKRGTSNIRVVLRKDPLNDNSPVEKVYEQDGNFFLCGFNNLYFMCKGANTKLKKELKAQGLDTSKRYYGGLYIVLKRTGNMGNGDYTIQQYAYHKVCSYLESLGYTVYVESRLD